MPLDIDKSRKEIPQKLTQLSSRSHPRHLVGKRTAQKDTIIDITSDSQVNSNFPYRWSPASLTFNNYFYPIFIFTRNWPAQARDRCWCNSRLGGQWYCNNSNTTITVAEDSEICALSVSLEHLTICSYYIFLDLWHWNFRNSFKIGKMSSYLWAM